jgi:hypothetical protein
MKNLFLAMILSLVALSAQAVDQKNKNAKYAIAANGNCEQYNVRSEFKMLLFL